MYVLIHGGYHGAWCWEPLLPYLRRRALAVDLPGRGTHPAPLDSVTIEASARSVVADVDAAGFDQVVVVAHSLGGATAPAVARLLGDRVRHLVFVSCLLARDGESIAQGFPPELMERALEQVQQSGPGSEIDEEHHRHMLCNDLTEQQSRWVLDHVVPDSPAFFTDPVHWGSAKALPATYLRLLRDQALPPNMQDVMISRLAQCDVVEIDSGHQVMISQPERLAAVLESL
ncbi:MAG: alpha/beta fold hydrolase [Acidimicrobiales bacterium]|nr:alpha/beta fold hydrolase [Acidimicrobiales bacterium]